MMSASKSICRFRDGFSNLMCNASRIRNEFSVCAALTILKFSGSMRCWYLTACSLIAENVLVAASFPVYGLRPLCSATRLKRLHVVMPTYDAEQRHTYLYTTNDWRSRGVLSLNGNNPASVLLFWNT